MKIITKIIKILSYQNCLLCKQSADDTICNYCFDSLLNQLNFQKQQIELNLSFDYFYLLRYSPEVRFLLQRFKFNKDLLAAEIFSKVIRYWWDNIAQQHFKDVDAIAAVPIHRYRYLYRGFNQAEVLAKTLSEYTGIRSTFENYARIKYTKSQAKSSKQKRAIQIKGVFSLTKPIKAKHLVVFDDVLTTGSTLREFIETLAKDSQIEKISVVTLVRPE
ncbi:ComF family protein [Francisella hispaniensis]|uniref:Competence protein F n=2 Tax=Francisella hispaniensis TaxID=622488 RepID=F4BJC8_9GAMM|nr:phosphoribosyltransferase family protein [Francisella hispaniensis]AEB28272.1 Competence protein F [Francisella hispaniensis]APD50022.1 amidophosphoribosyltransferase [Francisella hispaniensis FSC454]KYW86188.1 amidophosphoribosyltransferase [Francisella hispaniensis FSC454]